MWLNHKGDCSAHRKLATMRHARLLCILVCAFCGGIDAAIGRSAPPKRRDSTPRVRASAAIAATRSLTFTETMVAGAVSRSIAQTAMQPANVIKVRAYAAEWCSNTCCIALCAQLLTACARLHVPTLLQTLLQGKSTASQVRLLS